jgi:hypothetical protein
MIYEKPWYYTASHFILGFFCFWFPLLGILVLIYQLGQFVFNVRVFPVEGKIEKGNTIEHTGIKLTEIGVGYGIGYLVKSLHL